MISFKKSTFHVVWIALASILLLAATRPVAGIKILSQNSTAIEVETDQAYYLISADMLTIWVKLPGGIRSSPYTSQYIDINEMFRFKTGTTCYAYGTINALSNWTIEVVPGSATTPTTVVSTARYGINNWCEFSSRYYLVDAPMTITVANKPVVIAPGEVKYSFSLRNCSSLDQLLNQPALTVGTQIDPLTTEVVGRYGGPRIKITFFQDPALLPYMIPTSGFDIPQNNGSINGYWDDLCKLTDPLPNRRGAHLEVPADFNFTGGVTIPLKMTDQGFDWQMIFRFVNWAFADSQFYIAPSTIFEFGTIPINFLFPEPIRPDYYKFSFKAIVRPMHHFEADYDPSISILFDNGAGSPDGAASPDVAAVNIAAPVAGVVVSLAVIAIIAALFASSRVRRAILPYSRRRAAAAAESAASDEMPLEQGAAASPMASPMPTQQRAGGGGGGWQNANTQRASLTNL